MSKQLKFAFVFVAFLFLLIGFQSKNTIAHASTSEEPAIRVVTTDEYDKISAKIAEVEKANPGIELTTEQVQQIVNDLGLSDIQVVAEEDTDVSSEESSQINRAISAGGVGFQQYSRTSTSFRAQAQVINSIPFTTIDSITGFITGYSQLTGSTYAITLGRNFTATNITYGNTKVLDPLNIPHSGKDAKYTINATVRDEGEQRALVNTIVSHPNGTFTN